MWNKIFVYREWRIEKKEIDYRSIDRFYNRSIDFTIDRYEDIHGYRLFLMTKFFLSKCGNLGFKSGCYMHFKKSEIVDERWISINLSWKKSLRAVRNRGGSAHVHELHSKELKNCLNSCFEWTEVFQTLLFK